MPSNQRQIHLYLITAIRFSRCTVVLAEIQLSTNAYVHVLLLTAYDDLVKRCQIRHELHLMNILSILGGALILFSHIQDGKG